MVPEMENADKDKADELERLERSCWRVDFDNKIEAPLRSRSTWRASSLLSVSFA